MTMKLMTWQPVPRGWDGVDEIRVWDGPAGGDPDAVAYVRR